MGRCRIWWCVWIFCSSVKYFLIIGFCVFVFFGCLEKEFDFMDEINDVVEDVGFLLFVYCNIDDECF